MRYEVLRRYKDVAGDCWLPHNTPLEIRIYPEDTHLTCFFTALIKAAYLLAHRGSSIVPLTPQEISECFTYNKGRGLLDRLFKRPDTRTPTGIYAPTIRNIPVHLALRQSTQESYDMKTHDFVRDVDTIERLINATEYELTHHTS